MYVFFHTLISIAILQVPHIEHADATVEIGRLLLADRCKRLAESNETPLRQIFNDVCRTTPESAPYLSFPDVESSMYKRRRIAMPALPTSCYAVHDIIRGSRFATIDGEEFYRGVVDVGSDGMALVFASDRQLDLMHSASNVYFDGTFKVVPSIFFQLFTLFVPSFDFASPVLFALMTRKTQALYAAIFEKTKELVPDFRPTFAMADFEGASAAAFRLVFGPTDVFGCWFHFAQAVLKRVNRIGLNQAYLQNAEVKDVVRCILGIPLLPASQINVAADELRQRVTDDSAYPHQLGELITYVNRQWVLKTSIGPERLSVRDNVNRTNNILESFHAALKRRIQVHHPNFFAFMGHLQRLTVDAMNDVERMRNGLRVRRPKQKKNILNEKRIAACIRRFDAGSYTRMDFLRAVSHSLGAHTAAFHLTGDNEENTDEEQVMQPAIDDGMHSDRPPSPPEATPVEDGCEVCLVAPRDGVALVPCGHARFCTTCADTVLAMSGQCPICRCQIEMVMRLFN